MAGLGAYALAGAAAGLGEGLTAQAKKEFEERMMMLRRQWDREDADLAHSRSMERMDRQNQYGIDAENRANDRAAAASASMGDTLSRIYGAQDGVEASAHLIKHFEGFRETPYDDGGTLRIGYGTDTVTGKDGTVSRVSSSSRVSREDADRDLARRLGEFQGGIIKDIGPDRWQQFSPAQQAALTSIAYNFGTIGKGGAGIADVVRNGSAQEIEAAIRALGASGHAGTKIGDALAARRNAEADLFAGKGRGLGLTQSDWANIANMPAGVQADTLSRISGGTTKTETPTNLQWMTDPNDPDYEVETGLVNGQRVMLQGPNSRRKKEDGADAKPLSATGKTYIKEILEGESGYSKEYDPAVYRAIVKKADELKREGGLTDFEAVEMALALNIKTEDETTKGGFLGLGTRTTKGGRTTQFRDEAEKPDAPKPPTTEATRPSEYKAGQIVEIGGVKYRFKGGDFKDKQNWTRVK